MKCVLVVVVFTICSVVAIPPQYRPKPITITLEDGQVAQLPPMIMPGPPRPAIFPPRPSDIGVADTFDIKRPQAGTFDIKFPQADTFDIKRPIAGTFDITRPAICPPRPSDIGVAGTFDIKLPQAGTFDIKRPQAGTFDITRPAICPPGPPGLARPLPAILPSFPILNRPAIGNIQPFNAVLDADVNVPQIAICPPKPE